MTTLAAKVSTMDAPQLQAQVSAAGQSPASNINPAEKPARLVCSEVWGGNRTIHTAVNLPGLHGVLFSQPAKGGRGGDVHYLSVCGSGILARMCLADVVGHGEAVARVSSEMHAQLRRLMNWPDERSVFKALNRRLVDIGLDAMTTAAAVSYYPPRRKLSISYAGHPPAWFYRKSEDRWMPWTVNSRDGTTGLVDGPLAIDPDAAYTRNSLKVADGDRLVLVTDGVLETPNARGEQFANNRLEAALNKARHADIQQLAGEVLAAIRAHAGPAGLAHDDVTFLAVEFIPGPTLGRHVWLALRNRISPPKNELPAA